MTQPMTASEAREALEFVDAFIEGDVGSYSHHAWIGAIEKLRPFVQEYAAMLDRQTVDRDSIPMPQSVDYARKMHCLADAYLKAHDSEYKTCQTVDREGVKRAVAAAYWAIDEAAGRILAAIEAERPAIEAAERERLAKRAEGMDIPTGMSGRAVCTVPGKPIADWIPSQGDTAQP